MSINVRTLTGGWGLTAVPGSDPGPRRGTSSGAGSGTSRTASKKWRATRRHSRVVIFLRFVLPVLSLIVAASLFVSVRTTPDGIGDIDLGEVGLDGTTLTMKNPSMSGFNDNGTSYQVTAKRAMQDITNPRVVTLELIDGTMKKSDGSEMRVQARNGVFDADAQTLDLSSKIVVRSDNGDRVFMESANIDMKAGAIHSNDPVSAETSSGRIRANTMEITDRGAHLLFTGKVVVELRLDGGKLDGGPKNARSSRKARTSDQQDSEQQVDEQQADEQ